MRIFFAVELPAKVKLEVMKLAKKYHNTKFVNKENLHITLKFLGEAKELSPIVKSVSGIVEEKFEVQLSGFGGFPDNSNVRVLWLGVKKGSSNLVNLENKIDKATENFASSDKNFVPHVTLSRCNGKCDRAIFSDTFTSSNFAVDSFVLMKSEMLKSGAVYSVIKRFRLI